MLATGAAVAVAVAAAAAAAATALAAVLQAAAAMCAHRLQRLPRRPRAVLNVKVLMIFIFSVVDYVRIRYGAWSAVPYTHGQLHNSGAPG